MSVNEITFERDFNGEMRAIFGKYPLGATLADISERVSEIPLDIEARRFNIVKETEHGSRIVVFAITIEDVLRGINGRYKGSDVVKYHVIPAELL